MIKKVEDLDVFKLSHSSVLDIYKLTENFPQEERFGLIPPSDEAVRLFYSYEPY